MKKKNKGVSLIEIIISIGILGIILVSFLTMFTFGFTQISQSGNKNKDSFTAQKDLEKRLATGESSNPVELEINFGGITITSVGGEIESQGGLLSRLTGFLPSIPVMVLENVSLVEGYEEIEIKVETKRLNLDLNNTKFSIHHKDGITSAGELLLNSSGENLIFSIDAENSNNALIKVPAGLINSTGPYIIKGVTSETGKPDKISRATLIVYPPNFISAGSSSIYVSDKLDTWMDRDVANFPSFSQINDIVSYGNGGYIAVGNGGIILKSENQKDWKKIVVSSGEDLNSIIRIDDKNLFIAAGTNGSIYTSVDGNSWTKRVSGTSKGIIDMAYNENKIVAVGENGLILNSSDGISWNSSSNNINVNINGIAWAKDKFVAVGEKETTTEMVDENIKYIHKNGIIIYSENGSSWTEIGVSSVESDEIISPESIISLKSISYGNDDFVAVGENGKIISSKDGLLWEYENTELTKATLNKVVYSEDSGFIIVGDSGVVIFKDENVWKKSQAGSNKLNSVAARKSMN